MTYLLTLCLAIATILSSGNIGTPLEAIRGWATWYEACDRCAAAGPALRHMLGKGWRNEWVTVSTAHHEVRVKLTDWCACGERHGDPTVIDLSRSAFAELVPPGQGVVFVTVESVGAVTLPPTDTE
jgi:hypothetical protein